MANQSKELGQQAGIIDYINKLSSNAAAAAEASAAAAPGSNGAKRFNGASASTAPAAAAIVPAHAIAVQGGERAIRVPDSEGHQHHHHAPV